MARVPEWRRRLRAEGDADRLIRDASLSNEARREANLASDARLKCARDHNKEQVARWADRALRIAEATRETSRVASAMRSVVRQYCQLEADDLAREYQQSAGRPCSVRTEVDFTVFCELPDDPPFSESQITLTPSRWVRVDWRRG